MPRIHRGLGEESLPIGLQELNHQGAREVEPSCHVHSGSAFEEDAEPPVRRGATYSPVLLGNYFSRMRFLNLGGTNVRDSRLLPLAVTPGVDQARLVVVAPYVLTVAMELAAFVVGGVGDVEQGGQGASTSVVVEREAVGQTPLHPEPLYRELYRVPIVAVPGLGGGRPLRE